MSSSTWLAGHVFRCAWCHAAAPVSGGLLYYSYTEHNGGRQAVPGDPALWSESDGICPAHRAAAQ